MSSEAPIGRQLAVGIAWAVGFTAIIAATAGALTTFDIVGPGAPFAYPWRLTVPDNMARVTAWVGYALHNLAAWGIIAAAQRQKPGWSGGFRWFNWALVGVHSLFIVLHIVQTRIWYDGLARDVPEITALASVALMLMVVLVLENPRRGLAFGKKVSYPAGTVGAIKRYHGYLFSWALIYTFWYHPTEGTEGHLVGFLYMFMLFWQSALLYARAHRNKWWTVSLELLVLPHGAIVAWHQGSGMWPMFAFGFGAMFVLTQMYGLGWSRGVTRGVTAAALVGTVAIYAALDRLALLHEIVRIPVLDYGVVALIALGFWIRNKARQVAGA